MERINALDQYQKGILLVLVVMLVVFTIAYAVASARVGFLYLDKILLPHEEDGNTVYAGTIAGEESRFVVTPEKEVTYYHGSRIYGPYTAKKDPTARPDDEPYLTGVEIRKGEEVYFRGAVYRSSDGLVLFGEDGGFVFSSFAAMSNGIAANMDPDPADLLELMSGPQLRSKGEWTAWFLGLFVTMVNVVTILFADELFRWNLAFRINHAESAEPSEWEIGSRYIGWIGLTVIALVIYLKGLQ